MSKKSQIERFLSHVHKNPSSPYGCWLWAAHCVKQYGMGYYNSKKQYAHRISYQIYVGPIPKGLDVDHVCGIHRCVNPAHLQAVTRKENVRRRPLGGPVLENARKTHCKRGHLLAGNNLRSTQGRSVRQCKQCHTEMERVRRPLRRLAKENNQNAIA